MGILACRYHVVMQRPAGIERQFGKTEREAVWERGICSSWERCSWAFRYEYMIVDTCFDRPPVLKHHEECQHLVAFYLPITVKSHFRPSRYVSSAALRKRGHVNIISKHAMTINYNIWMACHKVLPSVERQRSMHDMGPEILGIVGRADDRQGFVPARLGSILVHLTSTTYFWANVT